MKRIMLVFVLMFSSAVFADDEIYTGFFSNNAVGGYDTVSFFSQNGPIEGKSQYKTTYKGTTWLFSSAENLAKFTANPAKYAPQYGGYCAWAIGAKNDLAPGKPKYWTIIDGKLYLNYSDSVQKDWLQDAPGFIAKGDKNWAGRF